MALEWVFEWQWTGGFTGTAKQRWRLILRVRAKFLTSWYVIVFELETAALYKTRRNRAEKTSPEIRLVRDDEVLEFANACK